MTKTFNKYAIIIITILLAELLNAYAFVILSHYKDSRHPYQSVAISMVIAVVIFYPAFKFIEKYLKGFSNKYMQKSRKFIGSSFFSALIAFILALFLLFMAFANLWYDVNPMADLRNFLGH